MANPRSHGAPEPVSARPPGSSVLFPGYDDSGTTASLVITALRTARRLTPDLEVIVVNDKDRP
jgi:hypothetical protein